MKSGKLFMVNPVAFEWLKEHDVGYDWSLLPDPVAPLVPFSKMEARRHFGLSDQSRIIGFVGRMDQRVAIPELLDAFETLLFQIYGRQLDREHRFVVDADGYRSTRKKELQAMARFAGDQVRKNGRPFTFGVLNSTERRIIHTTLQSEDDLTSESVGEGRDRRLQVRLK